MKTFSRKSIWRCFNTYTFIIFAPIFYTFAWGICGMIITNFNAWDAFGVEQWAVNIVGCIMVVLIAALPTMEFASLNYVIIDEDKITFSHAITKCERCYKFKDIESHKKVETKIATYIKLKFHTGKSKSLGVAMVTNEQLKSIFRILSDKTSNNYEL